MNPKRILAFTLIIMSSTLILEGQSTQKVEIEKRIGQNEFPGRSLHAVEPITENARSIKYYLEVTNNDTSYEIKLKYFDRKLSIEFNSNNTLQDIEELNSFEEIPVQTQNAITNHFDNAFERYKIVRIQKQYLPTGNVHAAFGSLARNKLNQFNTNWEIVVSTKSPKGKLAKYEFLFSNDGAMLRKQIIKGNPDDIILY